MVLVGSKIFISTFWGLKKMISNRKFLSVLFLFSSLSSVSKIYTHYQSHYFSNWEVFHIVETKDERGFDAWMSTRPNVNIFNAHNQTPLMIAAQLQHYSFVTRLLDAGAIKSYVDNFGKTARDYSLIAEGYYDKSLLVDSTASDSSNVWGAVGAGVAAGLCTYALCALLQEASNQPVHVTGAFSYGHYCYDYCAKCSGYVGYTSDPLELYCSSCYRAYCKQQQAYNQYSSSYKISDRL